MANNSGNIYPLVTVNILSFNRKDELRHTLTKVFEQDYKNIEVIVVDNASSDGTQQMVKEEFQNAKLIELTKNIGIAGWNKGFEIAKGEYVFVLDDDSYPANGTIRAVIEKIVFDEKIAIVACKIFNGAREKYETSEWKEPFNHFVGCGAIIRKNIFIKIGGFDKNLFIYTHESDFAIRVINDNYKIVFSQDALVYHRMFSEAKLTNPINNPFYFEYSTMNNFYLNSKYLPIISLLVVNIKYFINRLLVAAYYGFIKIFLVVIYKYITKLIKSEIKKVVLSKNTLEIFNYRMMPLFDREYFGKLNNSKCKLNYIFMYFSTFFKSSKYKNEFVD